MSREVLSHLPLIWSQTLRDDYVPEMLLESKRPFIVCGTDLNQHAAATIEQTINIARLRITQGETGPLFFAICEQVPDQPIGCRAKAVIDAAFAAIYDSYTFRLVNPSSHTHHLMADKARSSLEFRIGDIAVIVVAHRIEPFPIPLLDVLPLGYCLSRE